MGYCRLSGSEEKASGVELLREHGYVGSCGNGGIALFRCMLVPHLLRIMGLCAQAVFQSLLETAFGVSLGETASSADLGGGSKY